MKKISLGSMVFDLLKDQPEKQLTARQIAKQVFAVYPAYCMAKREASTHLETENDVITQLAAEIGAHRPALQIKHPQIKTTAGRPKKILLHGKNGRSGNRGSRRTKRCLQW